MLTHLIVALPEEAKPLVARFGLKRRMQDTAFTVYEKNALCLTVSGVGKTAAAAGVAYSHVVFGKQPGSIWLNVGTAGHASCELGCALLAHKITDADSGRRWYPPFTFTAPCASADLWTVARPEADYPNAGLYDMEAAGFYESATRFTTAELVQCIKIVSDNRSSPVARFGASQVYHRIEQQLPLIDDLIERLQELAACVEVPEPRLYRRCVERWHFSAHERIRLKRLLQRWDALTSGGAWLPGETSGCPQTGKDVLIWLRCQVDQLPVRLT